MRWSLYELQQVAGEVEEGTDTLNWSRRENEDLPGENYQLLYMCS